MATETLGNLTVTTAWVDVIATYATAASVDVSIQNLDDELVDVVFGGASAPTTMTGTKLQPLDSVQGNAAHIWIRGDGTVSVTKL